MTQPIYECPFCNDAPAYRTRYMLWKHIHECIRKVEFNLAVGVNKENLSVITIPS